MVHALEASWVEIYLDVRQSYKKSSSVDLYAPSACGPGFESRLSLLYTFWIEFRSPLHLVWMSLYSKKAPSHRQQVFVKKITDALAEQGEAN